MSRDEIIDMLGRSVAKCGRHVPEREIRDAVINSFDVAWHPEGKKLEKPTRPDAPTPERKERWPQPSRLAKARALSLVSKKGIRTIAQLSEQNKEDWAYTPYEWITRLFPADCLLCMARGSAKDARTLNVKEWARKMDGVNLIVPSPMAAKYGKNKDGRYTDRCLDNTGPRRWLVIEFDPGETKKELMCELNKQAMLHWYLKTSAKALRWPTLKLVIFSGGKSLHGWYGPVDDEDLARELMAYAVMLGADQSTWTACQMIRLPNAIRSDKQHDPANMPEGWPEPCVIQSIIYCGL
jgi:hypothetical protein